jgi:hypothetical protein
MMGHPHQPVAGQLPPSSSKNVMNEPCCILHVCSKHLVTFTIVKDIFFSGSFCAIFWFLNKQVVYSLAYALQMSSSAMIKLFTASGRQKTWVHQNDTVWTLFDLSSTTFIHF